MKKVLLSIFVFLFSLSISFSQFISEIDVDQTGVDAAEFVEIGGTANASLNGYVLVLINGNGDESYRCYDLDGESLDANGFFTIGNAPGVDLMASPTTNWIQNGADAVALVQTANCPANGTLCTAIGGTIASAIVYDTNDADDMGLMTCLGETVQYNEDAGGNSEGESLQFDGTTWFTAAPTLGAENVSGLPIALINFEANSMEEQKSIHLKWATASEENNEYFSIQHSTDGITFREVGIQEGLGNTSVVSTYDFMHKNLAIGTHYYRLQQMDYDGTYEYTNVVTATLRSNGVAISIFPNPTIDNVNILAEKPFSKNSYFHLLNIQGQIVQEYSLPKDSHSFELRMNDFPKGVYYIRLQIENELTTHKIIKQ